MKSQKKIINELKDSKSRFVSALFSIINNIIINITAFSFSLILPLTYKNIPLTDSTDNFFKKYCLVIKNIYFCKKNYRSKNMFLVKRYFYSFLFIIVVIVLTNSVNANNKQIAFTKTYEANYSVSDIFSNFNLLHKENKIQNRINNSCKEVVLLNISEDNSLAKPFLELNFTFNFYLSEIQQNKLKNKLGFCYFELICKNKTDISYSSSINFAYSERNKYSAIVNSDNIILFGQFQI